MTVLGFMVHLREGEVDVVFVIRAEPEARVWVPFLGWVLGW